MTPALPCCSLPRSCGLLCIIAFTESFVDAGTGGPKSIMIPILQIADSVSQSGYCQMNEETVSTYARAWD